MRQRPRFLARAVRFPSQATHRATLIVGAILWAVGFLAGLLLILGSFVGAI